MPIGAAMTSASGHGQSPALRHVRQLPKGLLTRVTSPDMTADSYTPVIGNRARIQVQKAPTLGRRTAVSGQTR